jgi:ribonuclease BN (tRNA processing enzyme)
VEFTVIGHRAGWPDARSPTSAYLVTDDDTGTAILLDCGAGATAGLRDAIETDRLSGVWISHLHPDHCFDLQILGMVLAHQRHQRYGDDYRDNRCPLYLPRGGTAIVKSVNYFYRSSAPAYRYLDTLFEDTFDCVEYEPLDQLTIGSCRLDTIPMEHAGGCCGVRITDQDGTVIGYSGDTGPCAAVVDVARDAALFVSECTSPAHDVTGQGHLCAEEAGEAASVAAAERLLLTHFFDETEDELARRVSNAEKIYDGPVLLASTQMTVHL